MKTVSLAARAALLVLAVLDFAGCASTSRSGHPAAGYGLVIDASSSGSTLFAYRWTLVTGGTLPTLESIPLPDRPDCARVTPGLGAYGGRPAAAVRSIEPLVRCAEAVVAGAEGALETASLHVLATAGLRLLAESNRTEIIRAVADALATTSFSETSARILSGAEEGVYGWLSVNHTLGHLGQGDLLSTVGALDLGGGSSQITFVPSGIPREHFYPVTLGSRTYPLYSYSYSGLGQDRARELIGDPGCFLRNYPLSDGSVGTGDYSACRHAVREELERPCADPPCSLFGVYQPPPSGDFLAFSVYAYTADFFGLDGLLTPATLEARAAEFCAGDWSRMIADDPSLEGNPYLPTYCFSAAYVVTFLTEGLGFAPSTERIRAALELQGSSVSWTKGALLFELAGDSD